MPEYDAKKIIIANIFIKTVSFLVNAYLLMKQ